MTDAVLALFAIPAAIVLVALLGYELLFRVEQLLGWLLHR